MADARAIGPALSDAERKAFVAEARTYLSPAVPFRHQGRSRRGVDCAGLVAACLVALGRPIADRQAYGREPFQQQLRAMLVANFGEPVLAAPVDMASLQLGDVPLMRFRGEPSHVAIIGDYLYGGPSLIHSYAQVRKVTEHRIDSEWLGYITEVFRP